MQNSQTPKPAPRERAEPANPLWVITVCLGLFLLIAATLVALG